MCRINLKINVMKTKMSSQDIKLKVAGVESGIFIIYVITFKACKGVEIAYFTKSYNYPFIIAN